MPENNVTVDYDPFTGRAVLTLTAAAQGYTAVLDNRRMQDHEYMQHHIRTFARQVSEHIDRELTRQMVEVSQAIGTTARQQGRRVGWDAPIPPAMPRERNYMTVDLGFEQMFRFGNTPNRPTRPKLKLTNKKYKWTKGYPEVVKTEHCTARIIDTPQKVKDEAETMRHCLWNTYEHEIKDGEFLAYHADVPRDICKSGITFNFTRKNNGKWEFDRAFGKANSKQDDPRLDEIYDKTLKEVTKAVNKKKREAVFS